MFTQTKLVNLVLLLVLCNTQNPLFGQKINSLKASESKPALKKHKWSGKITSDLILTHDTFAKQRETSANKNFIPPIKHLIYHEDFIRVEIATKKEQTASLIQQLRGLRAKHISVYQSLINADIQFDLLGELAKMEQIIFVRPAYKPYKASGNALSQGDAAIYTDNIRTNSGFTGSGIKVGAMSDSYNDLGGASTGVSNKELPGSTNTDYTTDVQLLADYTVGTNTDEGRALLEIVHDVAPAATLAFHTAFGGISTFASGINNLVAAGCDIIVEDVRYFASPMYMDGLVAQAAENAVSSGVVFISSAGNQTSNAYEASYNTNGGSISIGADFYASTHEFSSGDIFQELSIPAGETVTLVLQWDDPFASVTGATGADVDIDVFLVNLGSSSVVASSTDINTGGDPVEIIQYTNGSGSTENLSVLIAQFSGTAPSLIKYVLFNNNVTINEYATNSATCYAQSNAENVWAIGAVDYTQTPEYGVTPPVLQSYSSTGGQSIRFDNSGNAITPVTRAKPEFCGPDGANTSFFGVDTGDADSYPNFFGTSASAPHIAGLTALMLEAEPTATPTQLKSAIASTTVDVGTAGFDTNSGFGFADGESALTLLQSMVLPLEWGQIDLVSKDQSTQLSWETITETDTDYFEVEHSSDGQKFEVVDWQLAAGNSSRPIWYQFQHQDLKPGNQYYRIKQVDLDGSFTYSEMLHAYIKAKGQSWVVFPNPMTSNQIEIQGHTQNEDLRLSLLSTSGQILWENQILNAASSISIELPSLEPGMYYLKMVANQKVNTIPIFRI